MTRSHSLPALLCFLVAAAVPVTARAQAGLSHLDDATMVPRGVWRLQAITAWTRFDSRFAPPGSADKSVPLGADFTFDSLGTAQLPALSGTQNAIQSLTGSPFRLSLGATRAAADARVVVTPIGVEYGLFRRLTLGAMIPLVRTRMSLMLRVNADSAAAAAANVGLNPAALNAAALRQDSAVVQQLVNASASLQAALAACQANPSANTWCSNLLGRAQDVTTLVRNASEFAATVGAVYGQGADARGAAVVPLQGSAADALIRGRIAAFDSSFQALAAGTPRVSATPAAAGGPMGFNDFSGLVADPGIAGFDSLKSTVRVAPGDLELSARVLLFDEFENADTTHAGLHSRATLTGTYRLPTGQLATASNPLDIGTGRGTSSAGARLALYSQWGNRVGLTATAGYITSFGQTRQGAFPLGGAPFPPSTANIYPYTPGAVLSFGVAPRVMLGRLIGINAMYDYLHVAANNYGAAVATSAGTPQPVAILDGISSAPGTTQSVGFGITYSTVTEYDRGKAALPMDITFTHLEALSGAARMPRSYRDQIQLRFYYRRHRGR